MKELCEEYISAKAAETQAKARRIAAEEAIVSATKTGKLEGTETINADGYIISVTMKLNRDLDFEAYQSLELPDHFGFVDLKPTINLKKLRAMERIDAITVAHCIQTRPAKTSVKVEVQ